MKIEELLKKYEIESVEDFEPKFYIMNLKNGYDIQQRAIKNLLKQYTKEQLIQVTNYDDMGIVETVANNEFTIINNKIVSYEERDEKIHKMLYEAVKYFGNVEYLKEFVYELEEVVKHPDDNVVYDGKTLNEIIEDEE